VCRFSQSLLAADRRRELGRLGQSLEDDAVALGQLQQRRQLLLVGVRVQLEAEADRLEPDRRLAVDREGAAEIEVALGVDPSPSPSSPSAFSVTTALSGSPS
jgi:hypothetical protein